MTTSPPLSEIKPSVIDFRKARLRANPAYELILFDRLSDAERETLKALNDDPGCYGVLRPRQNSALSFKSVSRDTALLLFTLEQAGTLPRYAIQNLGSDCDAVIGRMVLDGILEIEADGTMISGPDACALIYGTALAPREEGRLAAISRRALEYAATLELVEPLELSAKLYSYNVLPASRRWRALLPEDTSTAEYLGLKDGSAAQVLSKDWHRLSHSSAWISWAASTPRPEAPSAEQTAAAYKLYVSPSCEWLQEAVLAVAESVARSGAIQWKVGQGIYGLLRPDKLVVYFRRFADLQEVALKIMSRLEKCPPHGVPFTAELASAGLLSWGIDPPADPSRLAWLEGESWRAKICNRLALALVQAGRGSSGTAQSLSRDATAARFAMQRLRLEGIDTDSWTPTHGMVWDS